jgi:CheY-like chemotaxis protein
MDWRMPVMDGIEATRRIRALPAGREVKIAILSASVFQEDKAKVLEAGADDFVPKPLRIETLFASMAKHLGVRFLYGDTPSDDHREPPNALDRRAVAALPAELRERFRESLASLDAERISVAVVEISGLDPSLGRALEQKVQGLQYSSLFKAFEGNP